MGSQASLARDGRPPSSLFGTNGAGKENPASCEATKLWPAPFVLGEDERATPVRPLACLARPSPPSTNCRTEAKTHWPSWKARLGWPPSDKLLASISSARARRYSSAKASRRLSSWRMALVNSRNAALGLQSFPTSRSLAILNSRASCAPVPIALTNRSAFPSSLSFKNLRTAAPDFAQLIPRRDQQNLTSLSISGWP